MLHILFGEDDFSIHEALESLKGLSGPQDILDADVTWAQVSTLSPPQLQALCSTVPFLSPKRMVVVEGLLALFEGRRTSRRTRGTQNPSSLWLSIVEYIPAMPPSTDLVLLDETIGGNNVLLNHLAPLGQVKKFPLLSGAELRRWIQERAAERGCTVSREGVNLLAEFVGGNLWVMSSEIEKLSLYCQGRTVEREDVQFLVSFARDMTIFNAVDMIMEARYSEALRAIRRLQERATGTYVVVMVARQVRLLMLAKDLEGRGVPQVQMGSRLGLRSGWVMNKVREQGRRYSEKALESLHRGLLETDRAIKTGHIKEDAVGEFLVEMFAVASLRPGSQ